MKVGGSLLSLIWGGGGRGTERNILVIRRHWVKLIAALWATIGLRTVISLLYKLGNGCMQSCIVGFGTRTRSLEYWSLWLQICAIFHCMKPHSLCQCLESVVLLLLALNSLKKCCSVCNLMHNYYSAYGLATHILIKTRHWSVRTLVCLSVCWSVWRYVCVFACLSAVEQVHKTRQDENFIHTTHRKRTWKKKRQYYLWKVQAT